VEVLDLLGVPDECHAWFVLQEIIDFLFEHDLGALPYKLFVQDPSWPVVVASQPQIVVTAEHVSRR
jgi:hypothetical protein